MWDDDYFGAFDHLGCIYLHVPRTGGISVSRALFGHPVGHRSYHHYFCSNRKKAAAYFKFAFVRNPWDRLVSAHAFLAAGGRNLDDRRFARQSVERYEDFPAFVHGWLTRENALRYPHLTPQHLFVNRTGRLGDPVIKADFVGRFERLEQDFGAVARELGVEAPLPRTNASRRGDFREYYDEASRARVAQVYAEDIALFGYSFDD
jgi:hypothetical protein